MESIWPWLPWKALKAPFVLKSDLRFEQFKQFKQGAYSYPLYEARAWSSDYIWKDGPFFVDFNGDASQVDLTADYLILYWMLKASENKIE